MLGFANNPVMGNAVLNVIFNASTAILFGFFLVPFTKLVQRLVPIKNGDTDTLRIEQAQMSKKGMTFSLAQIYALHEDNKTLISQVYDYNTYAFGLDRTLLSNPDKNVKDILEHRLPRDKKKHAAMYDKLKHTSDIMLEYLLPAKMQKFSKKDRSLLENIEKTIFASTKSAKSIKNIYHDIQDLQESSNKTMKTLTQKVLTNAANFYQHIGYVIDHSYDKKNFLEISNALNTIKKDHHNFIDYLTKELSEKLTKKELQQINVATLLNLDHYLYHSAKKLVTALQHTYLEADEEKVFKKMREVQEE